MPSTQPSVVNTGKNGLMDLLAGGHVDDVTFRQAIELLRAEDWEALRLLLAGTLCKLFQLETDGCVCLQCLMPSAFENIMQALLARGQATL